MERENANLFVLQIVKNVSNLELVLYLMMESALILMELLLIAVPTAISARRLGVVNVLNVKLGTS
jgi:hypothetical protein